MNSNTKTSHKPRKFFWLVEETADGKPERIINGFTSKELALRAKFLAVARAEKDKNSAEKRYSICVN